MFVLFLVVVIGFVSLALDIGLFLHERQRVQNAVDAAALAGAQELPDSGGNAQNVAQQWAASNDPDLVGLNITFRCIVGDRDGNTIPDSTDIPAVCDPGPGAAWTCNSDGICWAFCDFSSPSNKCNTIVVGANKDVPFYFGPVLSTLGGSQCFYDECNTGAIRAAACRGACGGPPGTPLDVVLVIDRTMSLCANSSNPCTGAGLAHLNNIKAGAQTVLQLYDPSVQHVGLAVLPRSIPTNDCQSVNSNSAPGNWLITPLSNNYNTGGVLNTGSEIVSNINCLQMAPAFGTQTNLGDPLEAAKNHLQSAGRSGVKKAIIFLTDGAANQPQFVGTPGSTGMLNCGAEAPAGGGDGNGFESNAGGACADGGANAQDNNSGNNTSTSCSNAGKDRHVFRDFNINIPPGAVVDGFTVRLDAWVNATGGTRVMCAELSWNGGASWTSAKTTGSLGTGQATFNLGNSSDNWGRSWTAANTSNANFRVRVTDVSSTTNRNFALDWVGVEAHYTTPPPFVGSCNYAKQKADAAQSAEIEIFTIGFGVESEVCQYDNGSPYQGAVVADLLADMATSSANDHGNCASTSAIDAENADGDHFLCEAKDGSSLAPIFKQAAEILASGSKMVPVFD
jgi:hypothetical protein